jgi:hypothetical protein
MSATVLLLSSSSFRLTIKEEEEEEDKKWLDHTTDTLGDYSVQELLLFMQNESI